MRAQRAAAGGREGLWGAVRGCAGGAVAGELAPNSLWYQVLGPAV